MPLQVFGKAEHAWNDGPSIRSFSFLFLEPRSETSWTTLSAGGGCSPCDPSCVSPPFNCAHEETGGHWVEGISAHLTEQSMEQGRSVREESRGQSEGRNGVSDRNA